MQCTAKYPCPIESLNLSVIPKIKSRYNTPVGFSDHSLDPIIGPLMAIGLGVTFIEKHFTLDRNLTGPDHQFSLIPEELKIMIDHIRNADKAKGIGDKIILKEERELYQYASRSLQSIKKIVKGEVLREGFNFDVLRPGNRIRGLDASYLNQVNGKKATKDIEMGDGIIDYE
jgi:N-acetylneuraminate synthase